MQAELGAQDLFVSLREQVREPFDGTLRHCHRLLLVPVDQRQEGLRQLGEIPLGDRRLVCIGIAAELVDGGIDRVRMIAVHEGAGAVVDRFTGQEHVVGVHDAVDEADAEPAGHEIGLRTDNRIEKRKGRIVRLARSRPMPVDDMVGQKAQRLGVPAHVEILEGADADMACRNPGQHGAGLAGFAVYHRTRHDRGKGPRRGNGERIHRLGYGIFAQYRAECGPPVAIA